MIDSFYPFPPLVGQTLREKISERQVILNFEEQSIVRSNHAAPDPTQSIGFLTGRSGVRACHRGRSAKQTGPTDFAARHRGAACRKDLTPSESCGTCTERRASPCIPERTCRRKAGRPIIKRMVTNTIAITGRRMRRTIEERITSIARLTIGPTLFMVRIPPVPPEEHGPEPSAVRAFSPVQPRPTRTPPPCAGHPRPWPGAFGKKHGQPPP